MAENVLRFNFLVGRNEVPAAADKNAGKLTMLASKTAGFGKVAAFALGGAAVAAGGFAAAGVAMGVKTAASMEQAQVGFTTLLGSGKKAQVFLADLQKFAAATPFELPGLIDSSRLLLGVGVKAHDVIPMLTAFGDAAGAVGVGQENFQRIMLATSQAISAGRFQTADLNQITENGIPVWKLLAEATHKPVPVLRDLASKGKLLASEVLPVLQKQMEKDYGGAMAKQSQTLSGLWSTLMDTINIGLANVLQPLMPTLKNLATQGIAFLGAAFSKLPGMVKGGMTALGHVKDYIVKNWLPGIRTAVGTVRDHLPKIDLGQLFAGAKGVAGRVTAALAPVAKTVASVARDWGGRILTGVQTGLQGGDWGALGKTLGDGLVTALTGLSSQSKRLVGAFTGWFGSIDWMNVGKAVGGQAVPFVVGFVNELFTGFLTMAKEHPMDLALFVAAFIPFGKLASAFGPLRGAIEHLPLGRWFTWLLDHTAAPVFDAVKKWIGFLLGGFRDGFVSWFPGLSKTLGGFFRGLETEVGARAMYAFAAARDFVYGLAYGAGSATAGVVRAIGSVIADMVRPFARAGGWLIRRGADAVFGFTRGVLSALANVGRGAATVIRWLTSPFIRAGGWLVRRGVEAVTGLARGVASMLGAVARGALTVIRFLTAPFARAGGWLLDRGVQVVSGLVRGVRGMLGRASDAAASVISRVVSPFRSAGRWLVDEGVGVVGGLVRGVRSMFRAVSTAAGGVVSRVTGAFRTAGRWLYSRGAQVISGFLGGLKSVWDKVTSWVSGIASWIRNHKGPISLDARLLIPAGVAIMTGFYNGLKSGAGKAWDFVKSVGGKTVAELQGVFSGGAGPAVSQGVAQWANTVRQVLTELGLSQSLLPKVLSQMQTESGGNVNAINLWDSNAKAGTPSMGLMQVIGPTFAAYAGPYAGLGIYNPYANIYAALNYAMHRYGSNLSALGAGHGYDTGGLARGAGVLWKGPAPERILSPRQTAVFERAMSRIGPSGGFGGGAQVVVQLHAHLPSYLGREEDVLAAMDRWSRRGQLTRIVRQAVA